MIVKMGECRVSIWGGGSEEKSCKIYLIVKNDLKLILPLCLSECNWKIRDH